MNKTALDALLIDRALGALAPEMEMLLDAYLARNPEVSAELERTHDTVSLVRDALKEGNTVSLPEFHVPIRIRQRRIHRYTLQVAGLAATLAIGLFFGQYHANRSLTSLQSPAYAVVEIEPVPKATGIWSITPDRLRKPERQPSNWRWHSPVQQPRLIIQGDES